MRKKLTTATLAVVGLGSLVVLGSSPEFIGNLLESVQNNPITRGFSIDNGNESRRSLVEPEQGKMSGVFPKAVSLKTDEVPTSKVPEEVLWHVIFSFPEKLEVAAENARIDGQDETLWTEYFIRQGNLLPENNQILNDMGKEYMQEIRALRSRAATIIQEWLTKNPVKPVIGSDGKPLSMAEQPAEFVELAQIEKEITLRYRDSFRDAIGEEQFTTFTEFLETEFAKGFVPHDMQPGEPTRRPEEENNGFEPFQGIKTGGNQ